MQIRVISWSSNRYKVLTDIQKDSCSSLGRYSDSSEGGSFLFCQWVQTNAEMIIQSSCRLYPSASFKCSIPYHTEILYYYCWINTINLNQVQIEYRHIYREVPKFLFCWVVLCVWHFLSTEIYLVLFTTQANDYHFFSTYKSSYY